MKVRMKATPAIPMPRKLAMRALAVLPAAIVFARKAKATAARPIMVLGRKWLSQIVFWVVLPVPLLLPIITREVMMRAII